MDERQFIIESIKEWLNEFNEISVKYAYEESSAFHIVIISPESILGEIPFKKAVTDLWMSFNQKFPQSDLIISEPDPSYDVSNVLFDSMAKELKYSTDEVECQDIKKGDVLVNGTIIVIVDHLGTFENRPIIYSWYFADSQKFYGIGPSEPDRWEAKGFTPATKEQRDLLFQKMKDAGYEWDEDKKELKKLDCKAASK